MTRHDADDEQRVGEVAPRGVRCVPAADAAAAWMIEVMIGSRPGADAVAASLLALSDGTASIIGDLCGNDTAVRLVLVAGAYGQGVDLLVRPLPGPVWTAPDDLGSTPGPWRLDLRTGVLSRRDADGGRVSRFQSIAQPGLGCLRVERRGDRGPASASVDERHDVPPSSSRERSSLLHRPNASVALAARHRFVGAEPRSDGIQCAATLSDRAAITVAVAERSTDRATRDRFAVVRAGQRPVWDDAIEAVAEARRTGYDTLLRDHCRSWTDRWESADIEIVGDPEAQRAVRYALFHLLSCASTHGESAVGARGLTGLAYAGHVFWDTDVFVLPTLAATLPAAARSILEYRVRRAGAARARAEALGERGLRFPWESADDGSDVTPTSAIGVDGTVVPILTGERAEHINSSIAWSLQHYLDWTGDTQVFDEGGRDLMVGTAEYLAGRARVDAHGVAHLDGVIGPDEYHEGVDDNAYTNGMARWHLRRAAELVETDRRLARRLTRIADALVTGYDTSRGRHEQFAGFSELEELLIGDIATPPVAADVLLGRDRTARAQIIKQPDVLMLHHLVPDACPAGSLAADIDYYLPRTAHGSSLSPAICAAQLARVGRPDEALALFDIAARLDLDDLTGTTAGGLHLATMGGLWQAVVWGFAGIRPAPGALVIEPVLPTRWTALRVSVVYQGVPVRVAIDHVGVSVTSERSVDVIIDDRRLATPVAVSRSRPSSLFPDARGSGGRR